jgi:hypothetical protein
MAVRSLLLAALAAGNAVELNPGNFKSSLEGKNTFIKFLAPW